MHVSRRSIGTAAVALVESRVGRRHVGVNLQPSDDLLRNSGITVYLPKPMTSGINAKGRFGKQDFVYVSTMFMFVLPVNG